MIDAAGFVRSCKQNCFSIPSNKPTSEIDFVTFRPSAKFTVVSNQVIAGVTVSDHLPVISILEMK
jgi:endonuclease/exonuclease/phosphatase family metal-dependent hydrolase